MIKKSPKASKKAALQAKSKAKTSVKQAMSGRKTVAKVASRGAARQSSKVSANGSVGKASAVSKLKKPVKSLRAGGNRLKAKVESAPKQATKKGSSRTASAQATTKKTLSSKARAPMAKKPAMKPSPAKQVMAKNLGAKSLVRKPLVNKSLVKKPLKTAPEKKSVVPQDYSQFREILLAKRRRLYGDVAMMSEEALGSEEAVVDNHAPIHPAEVGSHSFEQEFTLGLLSRDGDKIRLAHLALEKMAEVRYGVCDECGGRIPKGRLEMLPESIYCVKCASKLEGQGF